MRVSGRRLLLLLAVVLMLLGARAPLHRATHALPLSNDDAIPLLMARHALRGELSTILWNQPYNGSLDAYLLTPWLLLGSAHTVFRLYGALCGILLVISVAWLARLVENEPAAWAATLLAACGTPYMALMAATGPTPNFLMPLLAAPFLIVGLRRLDPAAPRLSLAGLVGLGLLCGLSIWNSALAVPALLGIGLGLLAAGLRPQRSGLGFLLGLAAGLSPLLLARAIGASAPSPVTALRPRWLWADGLEDLLSAVSGLAGLEVPQVVDGPERDLLPVALRVCLGLGLVTLIAVGSWSRKSLPLLGWLGALAAAFAFSRRTDGSEIRYLFGLIAPALTLAGVGLARVLRWRKAVAAGLILAVWVPWGAGHRLLLARWRDPAHAVRVWQVPPLEPVLETLRRARVTSAYASLQFAGRLTLESEERVIASQAWNERIPGDPLRFRDEVDLDPEAAWVLSPALSRGMPRAGGFRQLLRSLGGRWHEDQPGDFVVFRRFDPPFDETRPVPIETISISTLAGATLSDALRDRDPGTVWVSERGLERGAGLLVRVDPPRRVAALALAIDVERTPLVVPWVCDIAGEIVAEGPARYGLQWVNRVPRAGKHALLTILLGDRTAGEIRLIFQGQGPRLELSELFVYGPDEPQRPALGEGAAQRALEAARTGRWQTAAARYAEAVRLEPHRAAFHAALARARWRVSRRQWLDVEGLDDGGPALVGVR
jgi:hypothetical protein